MDGTYFYKTAYDTDTLTSTLRKSAGDFCFGVSRKYIEAKEPGDNKGEYHARKQCIHDTTTVPEILVLSHGCRSCRSYAGICSCTVHLARLLSNNVECSGSTDLRKLFEEKSSENEGIKATNQAQRVGPESYCPYPPVSPMGRV
ncbi:hypothetical protein Vadar_032352 [Vaccinium darrowii]|uniref:Uncharacterized protein n=1 Tax=Vaccinium darrowii TaxID=229202 RepID=A0ACB7ZFL9_9ERIC|nr:hypothetical protein Vadar_032352 [Vaccinium darrowii]